MNKKVIVFGLLVVVGLSVVLLFGLFNRQHKETLSNTPSITITSEKPILKAIAKDFSKKYNKPLDAFVITIDIDAGNYAKGAVSFKGEMGGGLWFAAKRNGEWQLVFDGNGIIDCNNLKNYPDFPNTLIPQCFDKDKNVLIKR